MNFVPRCRFWDDIKHYVVGPPQPAPCQRGAVSAAVFCRNCPILQPVAANPPDANPPDANLPGANLPGARPTVPVFEEPACMILDTVTNLMKFEFPRMV